MNNLIKPYPFLSAVVLKLCLAYPLLKYYSHKALPHSKRKILMQISVTLFSQFLYFQTTLLFYKQSNSQDEFTTMYILDSKFKQSVYQTILIVWIQYSYNFIHILMHNLQYFLNLQLLSYITARFIWRSIIYHKARHLPPKYIPRNTAKPMINNIPMINNAIKHLLFFCLCVSEIFVQKILN